MSAQLLRLVEAPEEPNADPPLHPFDRAPNLVRALRPLMLEKGEPLFDRHAFQAGRVLLDTHARLLVSHAAELRDWEGIDAAAIRARILALDPLAEGAETQLAAFVDERLASMRVLRPKHLLLREEIMRLLPQGPNFTRTWRFLEAVFVILRTS